MHNTHVFSRMKWYSGWSQLLNIAGSRLPLYAGRYGALSDGAALQADWQQTGFDMKEAMKRTARMLKAPH